MQPTEIAQNAIGALEHIARARSFIDMDALLVNAPAIIGDIRHVQPASRKAYCLWKHVSRILEAIAMHQSCAKSLVGISLDELNAVDGLLYDNMPFPNGIYDSELKSCFHALSQLTPTLSRKPGRGIAFIREEWIAKGYYEPEVTDAIQTALAKCETLASMLTSKLSKINMSRLQKELRFLTRLETEIVETNLVSTMSEMEVTKGSQSIERKTKKHQTTYGRAPDYSPAEQEAIRLMEEGVKPAKVDEIILLSQKLKPERWTGQNWQGPNGERRNQTTKNSPRKWTKGDAAKLKRHAQDNLVMPRGKQLVS